VCLGRGLAEGQPPGVDFGLAGQFAQRGLLSLEQFDLGIEAAHLVLQRFDLPLQFPHALGGHLCVELAPHVHTEQASAGRAPGRGPHRRRVEAQWEFHHLQPVDTHFQRDRATARDPRPVGINGDSSNSGLQFAHRTLLVMDPLPRTSVPFRRG